MTQSWLTDQLKDFLDELSQINVHSILYTHIPELQALIEEVIYYKEKNKMKVQNVTIST